MGNFPFYTGKGKKTNNQVKLPTYKFSRNQGAKYIPDDGLVKVANVALMLGQPLLITGDPGVGKTQFAYSLGWELNLQVYHFETKSTSSSKDLFYTYDTLRRFHDAQLKSERFSTDYITYNALGYAILRSHPYQNVKNLLPTPIDDQESNYSNLNLISSNISSKNEVDFSQEIERNVENWIEPSRSIVLIDEIDKAPRDFPNDLLNEIENKYFRIPELGTGVNIIKANDDFSPVIIITSNSEKSLPETFLRRCIYYNLKFPWENLSKIIKSHIPSLNEKEEFLHLTINFFRNIQELGDTFDKKSSLSEFKDWLIYLNKRGINSKKEIINNRKEIEASVCTMFKTSSDTELIELKVNNWLDELEKAD